MGNFFTENNLVEITGEHFIIDMMYATPQNITMHPVYQEVGFGNHAYLHKDAAQKLATIEPFLHQHNLKMRIRDAYRPPLAHQRILEILPVKGLFASRPENSLHCYGVAIDCCLTDINGKDLIYPTAIDAYAPQYAEQISHGKVDEFYQHFAKAASDFYAPGYEQAVANRQQLRELMLNAGFEGIHDEWWHFQLPDGKALYPLVEWKNISD